MLSITLILSKLGNTDPLLLPKPLWIQMQGPALNGKGCKGPPIFETVVE